MPIYTDTDGFLRFGADVLEGREVTDGLATIFGPDTGVPPTITDSGTVTGVAILSAVEAVSDLGAVVTVAQLVGVEALTDTGLILSTVTVEALEALAEVGALVTIAILSGEVVITPIAGEGTGAIFRVATATVTIARAHPALVTIAGVPITTVTIGRARTARIS